MEYKLDEAERKLVLDTLHYVSLHAYEDLTGDSYDAVQDLIQKLDPKPVQRHGWMVVWDGTTKYCKTSVIEDKEEADRLLGAMGGYPNVRIVRVTWEE